MEDKRGQSRHKKKSLRSRLYRYFSSFAIIPIIALSLIICWFILNRTMEQVETTAISQFEDNYRYLDSLLKDAYQLGSTISQDTVIRDALDSKFSTINDRYFFELRMNTHLVHIMKYSTDSIEAYVFGGNGGRYKSNDRQFIDELPYQVTRKMSMNNQDVLWQQPHAGSMVTYSLDTTYVSLIIPVHKILKETILGTVYMDIEINQERLAEDNSDSSAFYIIDEEDTYTLSGGSISMEEATGPGRLILSSREGIRYWEDVSRTDSVILEDRDKITIYRQSEINDWIYASVISKKTVYRDVLPILALTMFVIITLIGLAFMVSREVSNTLTLPLEQLIKIMSKVRQGDFTARANSKTEGEIGLLEDNFNYMVEDINDLMNQVLEEQEKARNYEIMLLQAQIKPHFLYNTFDSVIWLIRIGDYDDAIKMMQALTGFLRSGLSKGRDVIPLGQELANIIHYLEIQQLRYKRKLSFEVDIPEEMNGLLVPKLVLQPLVENALYHGIKNRDEGGLIYVYGFENDEESVIVVSDDGTGMSQEQLFRMKQGRKEADPAENGETNSYGFSNVYDRLNMYFDHRLTVEIESEPDIGTTIRIRIRKDPADV